MKKYVKSLVLLGVFLSLINFYGKAMVQTFSDKFQNNLPLGKLSINKPDGWFPAIVKENNISKIFNLIDERLLFTEASQHYFKNNTNGILLTKNHEKIILTKLKNSHVSREYMKKHIYKEKEYLKMKTSEYTIVIDSENEIMIVMSSFDKDIVYNILQNKKHRCQKHRCQDININ